jgi:hypothetical protein
MPLFVEKQFDFKLFHSAGIFTLLAISFHFFISRMSLPASKADKFPRRNKFVQWFYACLNDRDPDNRESLYLHKNYTTR